MEDTALGARATIGVRTSAKGALAPPPPASDLSAGFLLDAAKAQGSARLGQRCLRGGGCTAGQEQQSRCLDDVAPVENPDELGDPQFVIAGAICEISGKLGLGRAYRLENCREFVLHTHTRRSSPAGPRGSAFGFLLRPKLPFAGIPHAMPRGRVTGSSALCEW